MKAPAKKSAQKSAKTAAKRRTKIDSAFPAHADVWILAGQSNMEGCGYLSEALPPDPRVWAFDMKTLRWQRARDPLHVLHESAAPVDFALRKMGAPADVQASGDAAIRAYWRERSKGIGGGLGIAFGISYAKATGRPVGLIPCAHGGTSLAQWSHEKKGEGMGSLYGAMLERVRLAGGSLRGILWYQGESDASIDSAATYRDRFTELIHAVRRDTGNPRLPVLTVQIGCVTDPGRSAKGWQEIRRIQYELPTQVPQVCVTASIDLALNDTIHLDSPGQIRLGRRLARQALSLAGVRKIPTGPTFRGLSVRTNDRGLGETDLEFTGVTDGWNPARGMTGFSILDAEGNPHPRCGVTAAFRHPKRPSVIVVRTNVLPGSGDRIAYGRGLHPHCNAVDGADMPLCAFDAAVA
ncbi:MAG: sialate O-acetylesterase [Spirochaetes bacterium]|nr:sialate O-acetylesterase [Spirochaetota bacterium]